MERNKAGHSALLEGNSLFVQASVRVDISELTESQLQRLHHHAAVSAKVFEASIQGMLKGVKKYGPEPAPAQWMDWGPSPAAADAEIASLFWLPHIFSEAVDSANQTALFADALGVDL